MNGTADGVIGADGVVDFSAARERLLRARRSAALASRGFLWVPGAGQAPIVMRPGAGVPTAGLAGADSSATGRRKR